MHVAQAFLISNIMLCLLVTLSSIGRQGGKKIIVYAYTNLEVIVCYISNKFTINAAALIAANQLAHTILGAPVPSNFS